MLFFHIELFRLGVVLEVFLCDCYFWEKDLSDQLNVDAFDTEIPSASEKVNDPESEKKDRILATFAMGVSNLTILNVLGESMRDLTEILQIAIVTMARLEEAGIAPDI